MDAFQQQIKAIYQLRDENWILKSKNEILNEKLKMMSGCLKRMEESFQALDSEGNLQGEHLIRHLRSEVIEAKFYLDNEIKGKKHLESVCNELRKDIESLQKKYDLDVNHLREENLKSLILIKKFDAHCDI